MSTAEEANLPITNTLFPPPPPYWQAFTDSNLAKHKALLQQSNPTTGPSNTDPSHPSPSPSPPTAAATTDARTAQLTASESAELDTLRDQLTPPRADWINEDGRWMCFGQMYTSEPFIPTTESIGLPAFLDPAESPRTALPPVLHSFLHTLVLLVDALTNTARIPGELEEKGWAHEGDQYIQHLTNLAATMMVSANQLRGVQAESTLVLLMEKQLEARRQQTEQLRSKCQSIASTLQALKQNAATSSGNNDADV